MYNINLAQWVRRLGVLHIFSIEVLLHFAETLHMCMQNERFANDIESVINEMKYYICISDKNLHK